MKLLQISTTKLQYDGLTKVIVSLIDNSKTMNIQHSVACSVDSLDYWKEELKKRGVKVYEIPNRDTDYARYLLSLRKLIRDNKFDIVHIHGNSATMLMDTIVAKSYGAKKTIVHGHNTKTNHPFVHCISRRLLSNVANVRVACGKDAGEFLFSKPFIVIPNCIDLSKFRYNQETRKHERKRLKIEDRFVIGHVGRFTEQKNHEFLIEVFYELQKIAPNAFLIMIGEGELEDHVKQKVESLNLTEKVCFYGVSDNVENVMQAMDVFVLTSRFEGLCVTAIEAQASGLPCVVSDRLSNETKLSENFIFVGLESSISEWVEYIKKFDRDINRENGFECVKTQGYDRSELLKVLEKVWE